jgi:hypothetical protein
MDLSDQWVREAAEPTVRCSRWSAPRRIEATACGRPRRVVLIVLAGVTVKLMGCCAAMNIRTAA